MTRRTKAQWQSLVDEQSASGLNAVDFCKLKGLTYATFSARKSDLNPARRKHGSFVSVKVNTPQPDKPKHIVVQVNGIEFKLPAELAAQQIGHIVKACAT